jgi:PleD family two-component response regulator
VAACTPSTSEFAGSLVQRADSALYKAKHEGRDRVVVFGSEPSRIVAAL